ncbi:MAG: sulfite exporter TauE/SafE family protein [Flavobacteriales bacterium]
MELFGYLSAVLIGLILGLIGGGGSILTVPVLVYLFHIEPSLGTAYSLFVVGSSSLIGVFPKWKRSEVEVKTALIFGLPSMLSVFLTRKWLLPLVPDPIIDMEHFVLGKSSAMMLFFSMLMLFAAIRMLLPKKEEEINDVADRNSWFSLAIQGLLVGLLTGFVGVGGGFLIVPALVMYSKLPMKIAVGTSLFIISINSLVGFTGDVWSQGGKMDWSFLFLITSLSIIGIVIGGNLAKSMKTLFLRKSFAWFVLIMACVVFLREIL